MSIPRRVAVSCVAIFSIGLVEPGTAQSAIHTGRLAATTGSEVKPRQEFPIQVQSGQRIDVRLTSSDFDAYLELVPPDGDPFYSEPLTNDDFGGGTDSRVTAIASGNGTWRAVVAAYDERGGEFSLEVALGSPGRVQDVARRQLTDADSVSMKGRRYAIHAFDVSPDSRVLIEMTAEGFEPLLIVEAPSGSRYTSAEAETDGFTARIEIGAAEAGRWRVLATQTNPEEPTGAYAIRLVEVAPRASEAIAGELDHGDPRDIEGEHYDAHRVEGSATAPLEIQLVSNDFDAYLAARSPTGEWFRDDDGGGGQNARLELPAGPGTWLVIVTSFTAGETGRYRLTVSR
jgi:hypothetical protein